MDLASAGGPTHAYMFAGLSHGVHVVWILGSASLCSSGATPEGLGVQHTQLILFTNTWHRLYPFLSSVTCMVWNCIQLFLIIFVCIIHSHMEAIIQTMCLWSNNISFTAQLTQTAVKTAANYIIILCVIKSLAMVICSGDQVEEDWTAHACCLETKDTTLQMRPSQTTPAEHGHIRQHGFVCMCACSCVLCELAFVCKKCSKVSLCDKSLCTQKCLHMYILNVYKNPRPWPCNAQACVCIKFLALRSECDYYSAGGHAESTGFNV